MIEVIEAVNNIYSVQNNGLKWVVNVKDKQAQTLSKFAGREDSEAKLATMQSIYPTYASEDMHELIGFCMENGFYVSSEIIGDVIDFTINSSHPISDGVLSSFADYLEAMGIEVDAKKIEELEDYCLENDYQFELRLKEFSEDQDD